VEFPHFSGSVNATGSAGGLAAGVLLALDHRHSKREPAATTAGATNQVVPSTLEYFPEI
jgi:hypothetical protein